MPTTRQLDEVDFNRLKPARYFATNLVDPDTDITGAAEFEDDDGDLRGLTIIEPAGSVLETIRFLNGYHIL
jgi:hypothetical protein